MPTTEQCVSMAITCMDNIKESLQIKYQIARKQVMRVKIESDAAFDKLVNEMSDAENDVKIIDRALIVLRKHHRQ